MIDFEKLNGPFVITFQGEGRECLLRSTPVEVIDLLMSEDGGGFVIDNKRSELVEWLNDSNNWDFDEGGKPFEWSQPIGEMSSVNVTLLRIEAETPLKLTGLCGVELIAKERVRQIREEGMSALHDDGYRLGELADAAACYASVSSAMCRGATADEFTESLMYEMSAWPFEEGWWKPSDKQVSNLVKAGALIAAEIDRLQRLKS